MQEYQVKTNNAIRYTEESAMDKITQYFTTGLPSNIEFFADNVASRVIQPEAKQKLIRKITSKNISELKSDLAKILSPTDFKIIITSFGLDEFIPVYKDLHPVGKLVKELNKNKFSIYTRKNQSMNKIMEYYTTEPASNIDLLCQGISIKTQNDEQKNKIQSRMNGLDIETLNKIIDDNLSQKEALIIKKRYGLGQYI